MMNAEKTMTENADLKALRDNSEKAEKLIAASKKRARESFKKNGYQREDEKLAHSLGYCMAELAGIIVQLTSPYSSEREQGKEKVRKMVKEGQ